MTDFDIFIGGPMGDKGLDTHGTPYSQHLSRLESAARLIVEEIMEENRSFQINVFNPDRQTPGDIPKRVFSYIDRAELALMDISSGSDSVMYEIAYLHGLGIPVIPIGIEDHTEIPFYLKHESTVMVRDFEIDSLREALDAMIKSVLELNSEFTDKKSNPITNYYGLPLIDISATTGLATGYFHNFLRHVVKESNSVFHRNPPLKKLVILRPETLMEVASMKSTIKDEIDKRNLQVDETKEPYVDEEKFHEDEEQVRKRLFLSSIGEYIYDIPAPLSAQRSSPRYRRLINQITNAQGEHKARLEALLARTETNVVDHFFSVLNGLLNKPELDASRVEILSIKEFMARLS